MLRNTPECYAAPPPVPTRAGVTAYRLRTQAPAGQDTHPTLALYAVAGLEATALGARPRDRASDVLLHTDSTVNDNISLLHR